ncbi:MAG: tetratricopeptide repeat protein [Thermodesulfobacteriota bacterium]
MDKKEGKEIREHVAVLLKMNPYFRELPEESRKHALRAEVLTKEGKFDEAVKEYKEAIRITPFFPSFYKAIALIYGELKDYQKAVEGLPAYLELFPDAPDARAAKEEIYKWEFMMEKGRK